MPTLSMYFLLLEHAGLKEKDDKLMIDRFIMCLWLKDGTVNDEGLLAFVRGLLHLLSQSAKVDVCETETVMQSD